LHAAIEKKKEEKRKEIIANIAKAKSEDMKRCKDLFASAVDGDLTAFKRVSLEMHDFDVNWSGYNL